MAASLVIAFWSVFSDLPTGHLKTLGFLRKKNENDAFRFSCALKTHEGFLERPTVMLSVAKPDPAKFHVHAVWRFATL
jgi:hypothetical protein